MSKSSGDMTGVYPGVIQTAPAAPASADSVSYSVMAHLPTGAVVFDNAKPANIRLAGQADVVPARQFDPCLVLIIGKQVFFIIIEQPSIDECE